MRSLGPQGAVEPLKKKIYIYILLLFPYVFISNQAEELSARTPSY
jgi:hypothetical protein